MKAIVAKQYGPPDVLQYRDVPTPTPQAGEVRIRIRATAATSGDARVRSLNVPRGFGIVTRLFFGLRRPRNPILGMVLAGEVDAIGSGVTRFQVGDAVFGTSDKMGCYAEYVVVPAEGPVVLKPAALSFSEAAAVPFGALTSLIYLRDLGRLEAGQRVLINGASGALGVYAVQLAKHFGAHVTGVCSTANLDLVRSLGADAVIDYTHEDFTERGETYPLIYDTVGTCSFARCQKALTADGRLLLAVATVPQYVHIAWNAMTSRQKVVAGVASFKQADLDWLSGPLADGTIRPVVDRTYPLAEAAEAHRYVDTGRKRGSVVLTVD